MTVMTIEDPRIPPTLPRTVSCLCRRKACITTRHALLVKCRMVRPALVHILVSKTAGQPPTLVSMPAIRRTTARGSYSLVSGEVGGSSHLVAHGDWTDLDPHNVGWRKVTLENIWQRSFRSA